MELLKLQRPTTAYNNSLEQKDSKRQLAEPQLRLAGS
jgi:hypothetical protein